MTEFHQALRDALWFLVAILAVGMLFSSMASRSHTSQRQPTSTIPAQVNHK